MIVAAQGSTAGAALLPPAVPAAQVCAITAGKRALCDEPTVGYLKLMAGAWL